MGDQGKIESKALNDLRSEIEDILRAFDASSKVRLSERLMAIMDITSAENLKDKVIEVLGRQVSSTDIFKLETFEAVSKLYASDEPPTRTVTLAHDDTFLKPAESR